MTTLTPELYAPLTCSFRPLHPPLNHRPRLKIGHPSAGPQTHTHSTVILGWETAAPIDAGKWGTHAHWRLKIGRAARILPPHPRAPHSSEPSGFDSADDGSEEGREAGTPSASQNRRSHRRASWGSLPFASPNSRDQPGEKRPSERPAARAATIAGRQPRPAL